MKTQKELDAALSANASMIVGYAQGYNAVLNIELRRILSECDLPKDAASRLEKLSGLLATNYRTIDEMFKRRYETGWTFEQIEESLRAAAEAEGA